MNKTALFNLVINELEQAYDGAVAAAARAHASATNGESVAENKYDTFGLEASYLAQGQSIRVEQCRTELEQFKTMTKTLNAKPDSELVEKVELGSLVTVINEDDKRRIFLLGPSAAGLTLNYEQLEITCITSQSPIGQVLLGKEVDQEFELKIGPTIQTFEVIALT